MRLHLALGTLFVAGLSCASVQAQTGGTAAPIKIGWLVALTGPNSTPGIGIDRGVRQAVDEINKAGGVKGRMLQLVARDTQGDPTKAVNAALELVNNEKVEFTIGPTLSGEGLATTSVIARSKTTSIVIGTLEQLTDSVKYPYAFRTASTTGSWINGTNDYTLNILKAKKVGIFAESTGFGTSSANMSEENLKARGATVAYKGLVDVNQTELTTELTKAKNAGVDALIVWTGSAGLIARVMNARAELGWDVKLVGHPAMGTGSIKPLLTKPENWENVFIVGFKSTSYDESGKLPPRTQAFIDRTAGSVQVDDTVLWWVAMGYDSVQLIRHAAATAPSTSPDDVKRALEATQNFPGLYATYSFGASNRDGYPASDIVMNRANSFRTGAFVLAPGYSK